MLLTTFKIAVLFGLGVFMLSPAPLTYRAMAVQKAIKKQSSNAEPGAVARDQPRAEQEIAQLKAQVERLRSETEDLKKRLPQAGKQKLGEPKGVIKVYQVLDLAHSDSDEPDGGILIQVIESTVAPTTWDATGGEGSMRYLRAAGCLVVRQSPEIQKEVQELLEALKKALAEGRKVAMDEMWNAAVEKAEREKAQKDKIRKIETGK
jgi:hypothetical protein